MWRFWEKQRCPTDQTPSLQRCTEYLITLHTTALATTCSANLYVHTLGSGYTAHTMHPNGPTTPSLALRWRAGQQNKQTQTKGGGEKGERWTNGRRAGRSVQNGRNHRLGQCSAPVAQPRPPSWATEDGSRHRTIADNELTRPAVPFRTDPWHHRPRHGQNRTNKVLPTPPRTKL